MITNDQKYKIHYTEVKLVPEMAYTMVSLIGYYSVIVTFPGLLLYYLDCVMRKSMRKMRRFISSCGSAKYNPDFCSPFIHFVVTNASVSGQ